MQLPRDPNIRLFLGFLAAMVVLVLVMLALGPLLDAGTDMKGGDAATWFQGIATTVLALVTVKIATDSHQVARAAYVHQLRQEASNVTWWFELEIRGNTIHQQADVGWFVEEPSVLPWERAFPEEEDVTGFAVVCVRNENPTLIGQAQMLVDHKLVHPWSRGLKSVGILRPGTTRNLVVLPGAHATPASLYGAQERAPRQRIRRLVGVHRQPRPPLAALRGRPARGPGSQAASHGPLTAAPPG